MKSAIPLFSRFLQRIISPVFLIIVLIACSPDCMAGEFHNALSLQGFTGLLNTPNAEVTDEGAFYALYSNQQERMWRNRESRQDNYMFSVGFFSIAEIGGRVTDAPIRPTNIMDLSANFKVKVPFIPKGYYLPSIAFGMQDIGGGSTHLRTTYVVASEELWRFRLSLGYGAGPDRMEGVFGGVEFKAFDWLYLVGENDTRETNAGIRLVTPAICGYPVHFNVTAKTSLDYRPGKVIEFGFGLQFPLGLDHNNAKPLKEEVKVTHRTPEEKSGVTELKELVSVQAAEGHREPEKKGPELEKALLLLKRALIDDGFENVEVGSEDELLVIEYENSRYYHNELDGLGVVAGIAAGYAPSELTSVRFIMRKKGIRTLQLTAPVGELREFLLNADKLREFDKSLLITADVEDDSGVRFVKGDGNPSWLKTSVLVAPNLTTFIATEGGTFDYLLSIKPAILLNTWKGSVLHARWDIPVSWSDNFDDGKMFRQYRDNPQFERLMLFQAVRLTPTLMASLGAGMIKKDIYGTLNEIMWIPGSGAHRFRAKLGYMDNRTENNREYDSGNGIYLGSYRYYYNPLDTYLEVTGGQFWDQDVGFTVELKRFFGDTSFAIYYKDTNTIDRQHIQMGGVQFSFPLTPRRDMKPYIVQLRGSDEWTYAQETMIVDHGHPNLVGKSVGINLQPTFNLERVFYNRDRLMESYIRKHLLRLRDANIRYNKDRFP